MAGQPRTRGRPTRMASLLATASTASAMSLSSFQLITSSQVSLGCILAYDAPILGCSTAEDFTQGPQGTNVCSAGCKGALQAAEDSVGQVCAGANVPATSLLGLALSGGLVEQLCPSGDGVGGGEQRSSTVAVVITQTTRQIGTFSSIPTPSATATSATSDDQASKTETLDSTPTSTEADAEPTEVAPTTAQAPAPVVTSSVGRPTSAQQTKAPPQTAAGDTGRGGGSPFDIAAVTSDGSRRGSARLLEGFLFANVFVFLLWR